MRLYVETNFLLSLAFRQEQARECGLLLRASREGRIDLRIPTVCFPEAVRAVNHRVRSRRRLRNVLADEVAELHRGGRPVTARLQRDAMDVADRINRLTQQDRKRVIRLRRNLLTENGILPLDAPSAAEAALLESTLRLEPFDAAILAAILLDLRRDPAAGAVFVSTDDHLRAPEVREQLRVHACTVVGDFRSAVGRAGLP